MRTGRLSISRGHQLHEAVPALSPPPNLMSAEPDPAPTCGPDPARPATADYHAVHDRLTALERLTRLFELGALSAEEFAAEKALILAQPADELLLCHPAPVHFVPAAARAARYSGPSLVGRLLGWKLIPVGVVAGIGLSFATQPNETARFLEQTLRLFGA